MGRRADPENRASTGSEQAKLPQGVLTFLLTDIEASTPLWERHGASMGTALALHQALIARTVVTHDGRLIKRQGEGACETFTVRKQSFGVGVERTFPVHSPKIEKIDVASIGDVNRAKLYYLRQKVGKKARVREKR